MNINPISPSALYAIQAGNIPQSSRSSVSALSGFSSGNVEFKNGERSKSLVDAFAHKFGDLNAGSISALSSEIAPKYADRSAD